MKAEVIVTKKNNRKVKEDELIEIADKITFEDLFKYEEIHIAGGEPMLISERVVEMIHRLRLQGYQGKIYLHTAMSHRLNTYWACKMLFEEVDGVIYTINWGKLEVVRRELADLRRLDQFFKDSGREGKTDILYLNDRVYDEGYAKTLGYKWAAVRCFKDLFKESPFPEGDIVFYDLEAEG